MGIHEGKRILVTGVLTNASIAFHVAKIAQQEGAWILLTAYPSLGLTERIARRLPSGPDNRPPVIELDVTDAAQLQALAGRIREHVDGLEGVVHAIGSAPRTALGGNFLKTPWEDVATAMHASTYSLMSLTTACLPLLEAGGSVVGLDFDAAQAWPVYDWIGIPGLHDVAASWTKQALLGWDIADPVPAARACVALLSDWFPSTTGEIVHVDGGVHAVGGVSRPEP